MPLPGQTSKQHVTAIQAFTNQEPQCLATVQSSGHLSESLPQVVGTSEVRLQSLLETALATGYSIEFSGQSEKKVYPGGGVLEIVILNHVDLHNTK